MKILRRYFLKEFFKFFAIVILIVVSVSTVIEFFDRVDQFYSKDAPAYLIAKYLLLRMPGVILYAFPFASLFSILITIGIATKSREIVIIRSSGGSIRIFFSYFLVLGVIMSLLALVLGETLVTDATREAEYTKDVQLLNRSPKISYRNEALWLKGTDGSLIRIDGFVEDENMILKTSIFEYSISFGLEKRTEADEAEWRDGAWNLKNVTVFDFRNSVTERYDYFVTTAIEEPAIFREKMKEPIEMNFLELYSYYSRLEKAGFRNLKYMVRLYEKLTYPMINFVMILFGLSLGLNTSWGSGVKAAGFGVIITILYWLLYSINISLGVTGVIKPWLAPWINPVLFSIIGMVMYWRIRE